MNLKLSKKDKDQLRREQILSAAAKCVSYKGFHATSMGDIANAAKMQPGHIYRYFKNKEEIIKCIVESIAGDELRWIEDVQNDKDIAGAHIKRYFSRMDGDDALMLEIHAEGARNNKVAEILKAADKKIRDNAVNSMKVLYPEMSNEELATRVEFMASLAESAMVRGVKRPETNIGLMHDVLSLVMSAVFPSKK